MADLLAQYYNWIKALHIIAVIAWMAGMLYLPRLFAYHAEVEAGSDQSETFKIMERRLLRIIMNPAMGAVWVFGGMMLYAAPDLLAQGWMHVKLTGIIVMTVIHHIFARWRKDFARDENKKTAKFYKVWNEVPSFVMIIIVVMAVAEPF